MESFQTKVQKYEVGGAFLPLSKWDRDGFDATAIENLSKPEDIQYHYVLGKVYRVPILTAAEEGQRGFKRGDDMRGSSSDLKTILDYLQRQHVKMSRIADEAEKNGPER